MTRYVLDSYALLAYFREEPGADQVEEILTNPRHDRWLSVINLGEVYYIAAKRTDMREDEVLGDVLSMQITLEDADLAMALAAAEIKGKYALSYADCFAAVLAKRYRAVVVTGDEEFIRLEQAGACSIEWLPAKSRKRSR
jgi:ribonuclease VapC